MREIAYVECETVQGGYGIWSYLGQEFFSVSASVQVGSSMLNSGASTWSGNIGGGGGGGGHKYDVLSF
jgi:hypothetical protein